MVDVPPDSVTTLSGVKPFVVGRRLPEEGDNRDDGGTHKQWNKRERTERKQFVPPDQPDAGDQENKRDPPRKERGQRLPANPLEILSIPTLHLALLSLFMCMH